MSFYLSRNVSDDELYNDIKKSILNKTPLSYTRLGDGEIHVLKEYAFMKTNNIKFISEKNSKFEINYHNYVIKCILRRNKSSKHLLAFFEKFKDIFVKTIKNTSHIGLYTNESHPDTYEYKFSYLPNKRLLEFYEIDSNNLKICNPLFHKDERIGNIKRFKEIVNNNNLHFITSNAARLRDTTKIHNHLGVNVTYTNYNLNESINNRSIFKRDDVISKLIGVKEHIVIYSLGAGAKDICSIIDNKYKRCAIDLGSTVDAWAGLATRPDLKNKNKHFVLK